MPVQRDARNGAIIAPADPDDCHDAVVEQRACPRRRRQTERDLRAAFRLVGMRLWRVDPGDPDALATFEPEGIAVGALLSSRWSLVSSSATYHYLVPFNCAGPFTVNKRAALS